MSRCFTQLKCDRSLNYKLIAPILQLVLATAIFNVKIAAVNAVTSPELTMSGDDAAASLGGGGYEEKRSWQSLQGPWGKRALYNGAWSPEAAEQDDDDHWVPLLVSNGERADPFLKYSMVYLTNVGTLDRMLSQRQDEEVEARLNDDLFSSLDDAEGHSDDAALLTEKRTWKNMNAAWGKRRQAPAWNKFRGAWGKREPGWNNLKGMWGKRSSKDWQKLHGGWGKRSAFN